MNPLFPSISIDITGPDGNAYVIMAIVSNCLKQAGYGDFDINNILHNMMNKDYEHLLDIASEYITIKKKECYYGNK